MSHSRDMIKDILSYLLTTAILKNKSDTLDMFIFYIRNWKLC